MLFNYELFISKRNIGLDRKFTHCLYGDNGSLSFLEGAQSGHEGFPGDEKGADNRRGRSYFYASGVFDQSNFYYIITQGHL